MRKPSWIAAGIVAAGAAALLLRGEAGAQQEPVVSAYVAGVQAKQGTACELVVFNTTSGTMTLDLTLLDPQGTVVKQRAGAIEAGPNETVFVDLFKELARGLPRGARPYRGTLAVEVKGPDPFGEASAIVHVTQYHGSKSRPRAAYVLRPTYVTR